ncbi:hypothetical protein HHK36_013484 [Tetracentron sinense]|uniref:High-affinity potassium transporter n=1 Tax=Tetracentron sinense TaxID=13715 RepID=A0A835DDD6_TETSI|nr:hypothetical protein HHK36_013484 [Tetracentron sinense]
MVEFPRLHQGTLPTCEKCGAALHVVSALGKSVYRKPEEEDSRVSAYIAISVDDIDTPVYGDISMELEEPPLCSYYIRKCTKHQPSVLKPRTHSIRPKDLDLFFTSVSAATVSSMSTVEMEVFANTQLVVLTILMLVGGEIFTSMLGLRFLRSKFIKQEKILNIEDANAVSVGLSSSNPMNAVDQIELELETVSDLGNKKSSIKVENDMKSMSNEDLKHRSIRYLGYVVLGYFLVVHVCGSTLILLYLRLVPSARDVLKNKGLQIQIFSVFTTVSTVSNCGFIPTNENMIAFKKNSGLLLLLVPQILLGNTLFPPCLRLMIWVMGRFTKRGEFSYMLKNSREIGYSHLLPSQHSTLLVSTVLGFILVQFLLFCSMEWNSEAIDGLNSYQKMAPKVERNSNIRQIKMASLWYLPPYTSFLPDEVDEQCPRSSQRRGQLLQNLIFSQLSYLVIFVILICITERTKIKEDPLNFNVLNIVLEVVSAYGNVGFTTGYSCKRQLKLDSYCKDTWYGFAGRWSNKGKLILILVMFFGRLKKFNMEGGRTWKLS